MTEQGQDTVIDTLRKSQELQFKIDVLRLFKRKAKIIAIKSATACADNSHSIVPIAKDIYKFLTEDI